MGTLLEQLGNKKSDFIVMAVMDYLQRHPEAAIPGAKIKITCQPPPVAHSFKRMINDLSYEEGQKWL